MAELSGSITKCNHTPSANRALDMLPYSVTMRHDALSAISSLMRVTLPSPGTGGERPGLFRGFSLLYSGFCGFLIGFCSTACVSAPNPCL